jgi:hypothetical protein
MLCPMRKLLTVLADSFMIWSRNFTLIYVFLLALLLFSLIIPQSETPTLALRWILLFGVVLLLFGAVMAGWFNMVALACDRFLSRPRALVLKEASPLDALTLFKAFFPGVGRFFAPIVGGYLIQLVMAVLLMLPAQPLLVKNWVVLQKMALLSATDRLRLFYTLGTGQQESLGLLSTLLLSGLLVYALFAVMTLLWPAFVIYYDNNPLKACYRSIAQFFKAPVSLITLCLLIVGVRVPFLLLASSVSVDSNFILGAGVQLINLLLEIFVAVLLFVYVYQNIGPPTPEPDALDPSSTKDLQDDDRHDGFGD